MIVARPVGVCSLAHISGSFLRAAGPPPCLGAAHFGRALLPGHSPEACDQCGTITHGTSVAGGVLRLRPQRTRPSIITMPTPGRSPS